MGFGDIFFQCRIAYGKNNDYNFPTPNPSCICNRPIDSLNVGRSVQRLTTAGMQMPISFMIAQPIMLNKVLTSLAASEPVDITRDVIVM